MNLTLKETMGQWPAKDCPGLSAVTLGSSIGLNYLVYFCLIYLFFSEMGFCVAQAGLELSAS